MWKHTVLFIYVVKGRSWGFNSYRDKPDYEIISSDTQLLIIGQWIRNCKHRMR